MRGFLSRLFGAGRSDISGRWVEASDDSSDIVRGFVLNNDGTAMSVNNFAPRYEKWVRNGNQLTLTGKTMCGKNCLEFTETMRITKLTRTDMVLDGNEHMSRYTRHLD